MIRRGDLVAAALQGDSGKPRPALAIAGIPCSYAIRKSIILPRVHSLR